MFRKSSTDSNCSHFEWQMNGVGLEFNHLFGYGVMDAAEMVMLSRKWKTMPPRYHCDAGSMLREQYVVPLTTGLMYTNIVE
jgi:proprotein convertase subtilisin/kexin type 2